MKIIKNIFLNLLKTFFSKVLKKNILIINKNIF